MTPCQLHIGSHSIGIMKSPRTPNAAMNRAKRIKSIRYTREISKDKRLIMKRREDTMPRRATTNV